MAYTTLRERGETCPEVAETLDDGRPDDILEFDELCSFILRKKDKEWILQYPHQMGHTRFLPMMIRPPTLAETYRIVGLIDEGLRGVDVAYDSLVRTPSRRWFTRYLHLPFYFHWLNEGWVLEKNEQIVAWLYLLHSFHSTHINDIGVSATFRRKGFGKELLRWAEIRAQQRKKSALTLVVSVANHAAVELYDSFGFERVHYHLWQGRKALLPHAPHTIRPRLLDPPQRAVPFHEWWANSLAADGHPIDALLADQARYSYSTRGKAWELWRAKKSVGYADLIGNRLRLLMVSKDALSSLNEAKRAWGQNWHASPNHPPAIKGVSKEREAADDEGKRPRQKAAFWQPSALGTLLQEAWNVLHPMLPTSTLTLDLGSNMADQAVHTQLTEAGWTMKKQERMLMIKEIMKPMT